MEQLKWTTPNKADTRFKSPLLESPKMCYTPVKQSETKFKHTNRLSNSSHFSVLPSHITPPSGLAKFIARNPFESDLTNRLHLSVMSPTVFNKVSNSSQKSPGFSWNIDEIALIQPAKIEEFPMQQMHAADPETEIKAQAAIDRFFNANPIIPSPWEIKKKEAKLKSKVDVLDGYSDNLVTNVSKSKKDGWSQTVLSLPPQLPAHVEEVLKPYLTFTQDQNVDNDDANSSSSSLRRKLFFNHEEEQDNEEDVSIILSPVTTNGSVVMSSSPPQSGMLIHGTPVKQSSMKMQRNLGSSIILSENHSPPNLSPIHRTMNMSCESMRSKSRSVARLDFTADMSIECSVLQNKDYQAEQSLDLSLTKAYINCGEKKVKTQFHVEEKYNSAAADLTGKINSQNENLEEDEIRNEVNDFINKPQSVLEQFKMLTDSCKQFGHESIAFQQTNSLVGTSGHYSACNSGQDTGYQTYSMSNTMNVDDSCNNTPIKQKTYWGDRVSVQDDELRLSDWKENMRNIFSSTPSRCNREKGNYIL